MVDMAEDAGDRRARRKEGGFLGGRGRRWIEVEGEVVVYCGIEAEVEGEEGGVFGGED